jgi:omega-amidase
LLDNLLKIIIIQFAPEWENREANLNTCSKLIHHAEGASLIVLPEMFSTGFSMNVELLGETMEGPTVAWMKSVAATMHAVLAGSLIVRENGRFFNRFVWATPDGKVQWYDKRHLFMMGEEHLHYSPGKERVTLEWNGWRIRPLICYDLRFPVWSRNHDDYDLLLYVANWPSARHHVWKNLLISRAIENQCWCVGVNRTGSDGMNLNYLGDSGVIDARGHAQWLGASDSVQTFTLSLQELKQFREKFPVLNDRDSFLIDS